jgi:hypothetical protein
MCELTVDLSTSREEKTNPLIPETYSEKRESGGKRRRLKKNFFLKKNSYDW